jgi:hypothetical protein
MIARVVSVSERRVTLVPVKDACFGCMEGDCKKRPAPLVVECRGPVPAPGRLVETGVSPGALAGETLCGVLPPAAGFAAGYFLARFLFPHAGEGARTALGALCLFSGGLLLYLIRRRFPPKTAPRIIRVIETGGAGEEGPPPAGRGLPAGCPGAEGDGPPADHREAGITLPVSRNSGIFEPGS